MKQQWTKEELIEHFTLLPPERQLVEEKNRESQLGFAKTKPDFLNVLKTYLYQWSSFWLNNSGLITEQDIHAEMGDIILGKKQGRNSSEEITIFDSTGLSIQDISIAKMVLKMAKE